MFEWIKVKVANFWLHYADVKENKPEADQLPKCENLPELLKGLFLS